MVVKKPVKKKPTLPTKKVPVTNPQKEVVREVEMPVADVAEIQDGVMPTNSALKEEQAVGYATVALALGATINVGDYQSARVDVFIRRNVPDNDTAIKDAYNNMSELLTSEIERQSAILMDE